MDPLRLIRHLISSNRERSRNRKVVLTHHSPMYEVQRDPGIPCILLPRNGLVRNHGTQGWLARMISGSQQIRESLGQYFKRKQPAPCPSRKHELRASTHDEL